MFGVVEPDYVRLLFDGRVGEEQRRVAPLYKSGAGNSRPVRNAVAVVEADYVRLLFDGRVGEEQRRVAPLYKSGAGHSRTRA